MMNITIKLRGSMMKKNMFYISTILVFGLLASCSNNENKDSKNETDVKIATASGIEVVQNTNSKEIKVKNKKHDNKDKQYYFDYDIKSEYSQNARPANKDASIRTKPRTAVDANIHIRSPYEKIQISLLVKGLSKEFIVKCSACHNDYANGIIGPSLLGKDVSYIIKKINKFKNDKTANILMYDLVKKMDDTKIKELANEIFRFNKEIQKMRGN